MSERAFHVHRYDPEDDDEPRFETYDVPAGDATSVLDGLFHVQEGAGENLSFRFSCRQGVCGSCCMEINGKARLACQTPVSDLPGDVTVRPLYNLPVIKDLVVDMEPFFDAFREIDPSFESDDLDADSEPAVVDPDSRARQLIDPRTDCVGCGACFSGCGVAGDSYLGPAALNRALTLVEDPRDAKAEERLDRLMAADGAWACHTQGACSDVCPKDIPVSEGIQHLKREAAKRGLRRLLPGASGGR